MCQRTFQEVQAGSWAEVHPGAMDILHKAAEKKCKNVHKRVPQRFSKTINKKVCDVNSLNNILEKQTKRKSKAVGFEED